MGDDDTDDPVWDEWCSFLLLLGAMAEHNRRVTTSRVRCEILRAVIGGDVGYAQAKAVPAYGAPSKPRASAGRYK